MGGLGNQLFIYTAALYFQELQQVRVAIDTQFSPGQKRGDHHHAQISQLSELGLDVLSHIPITKSGEGYLLNTACDVFRRLNLRPKRLVTFDEPGYVDLVPHRDAKYLRGYFQTFMYLYELRRMGVWREPVLSNLEKHLGLSDSELTERGSVALHVRRGDYLSHSSTFGLLSKDYYSSALRRLGGKAPIEKVFIFTDDAEGVAREFGPGNTSDIETRIVDVRNPARAMLTMALAPRIVLGNSSFGWWAAQLGENWAQKEVIAPANWFRSIKEPKALIPDHWTRIESSWL